MSFKRLPPLNALRAFEAAARHLSFTRAAEELFVTQAAVSHQIKGLEEFLGMKLFLRKNRTLLLTEEGQSYFLEIKDIFLSLQEATNRLLAMGAKGSITIALPPSFAVQWLVPKLSDFAEVQPDIDVRIKAVDSEDGFLTDDVDLAIYYGRGRWPGLVAEKLYTEYLIPVCSPGLLMGAKPLDTLDDLKHHMLLHDTSRESWKGFIRQFNVLGVNVNQGPIFSHTMLALQAAALGQGIALVDNALAGPDIAMGRLVCPFEERMVTKQAYYIVCREAQAELGRIQTFKNWVMTKVTVETN
ncbi:transcriptional regulator GcvA [Alteromonas sp. a30]|uniref:transcriptional regulator GcvA n=1 Tax=Alteromonas sp. a30 TaxID=2730917 RepID=UPI002281D025|nr:transcriptional regulator GcvA [Alteromonas sp. a30]MCY7296983.1 transcriptional regulator GcvA [Alteromonas sp. a30]